MNVAFQFEYGNPRAWCLPPLGELIAEHEETLKGLGEILHVVDGPGGARTYVVRFTAEKGGWKARRLAEETRRELDAGLWHPICFCVPDRDFLAEDGSVVNLGAF